MNNLTITDQRLPADRNPALVYLAKLPSANSRRVMRHALEMIVLSMQEGDGVSPPIEHFPWWGLRYQHTQAIRSRLMESYSIPSVNRHLSALRGILKECWRLGMLGVEDYQRAVDIPNVKGTRLPAGRNIPEREIRKLLMSCYDDGVKGIRDLAIIAILATCGLRRAEFEALNLDSFEPTTGALTVLGKGRKERSVYVVNQARTLLDEWLTLRGDLPGPLFYSVTKGGQINSNRRMSAQAAYNMIGDRAKGQGLKKITPHDFRRTFIGNMLDAGVDAVTIANITGHASVDMLKRYDRRPENAKREAQSKIKLPI